jgi:hypothetical protein
MPIRPSAGNSLASNPVEYCVAAPIVWFFAYGEKYKCFVVAKEKEA